jgi:hypothetical protein
VELAICIEQVDDYPVYDGPKDEPVWSVLTHEDCFTASEMAETGLDLDEYEADDDGVYRFDEAMVTVLKTDLTYFEALELARKLGFAGPTFGG